MFCQFRQIISSIGIHTTRVNIDDFGDFDKFGNFGDGFANFVKLVHPLVFILRGWTLAISTNSAIKAVILRFG